MSGPGVLSGADPAHGWVRRALLGLVVAVAGAAVAVAATGRSGGQPTILTAMGGFATSPSTETLPASSAGGAGLVEWPAGQDGWTIALATLPQSGGKPAALARARRARKAGLPGVGLLDTSQYASLHPGYWLVFTGSYTSEAEATSALQSARSFSHTAGVRRIVS
jgi:hypothetical protein